MTPDSKNNDDIKQHLLNIEARLDRLSVSPQLSFDSLSSRRDDEIDLRELASVIWEGKWIIIAVTALFAAASVFYALSLPNIYQSKSLLAPSESAQGGGMSRVAGQLGGLASLAGISIGSASGGDKVAVSMAVLKSRKFINEFVERHNILPELMAVKMWDSSSNQLFFDEKLYSADGGWIREVKPPKVPKPSEWEAFEVFTEILEVTQDKETGFVTVAVEHQSPVISQLWVSLLVKDLNRVMKEKDVSEAQRSIEFLKEQLIGVALADMRTVFYQLIEEQTKTIMLAEVREEYVFSTIDPPVVPEQRVKPKRAIIAVIGVLLGGMLSLALVLIRYFMRKDDVSDS